MSSPTRRRIIRFATALVISLAVPLAIFWGTFVSSAFESAEPGQAIAPVISATMVDAISADADGDGRADAGDTLQYTVTINNTGPDPALTTIFTDTLPLSLTLVPGSVNASPIGFNDSYTATGNVRITVAAASGVLANDIDPNTGNNNGLTASAGATSTNGGNVTMNADGGFIYNPPAGFEGSDTFNYTVTDPGGATGTGTVTFTVSGMIWFVQAGASAGGNGRLTNPFNCLVGAGCFDPVAADDPGDNIFIYSGSYTGGITLANNQRLIGQGATASISTITGITPPTGSDALPSTGGTRPTVSTATATSGVFLASGNTLRGFNIGNTGTTDITGTNFGTLTASDIELNGTGRLLDLATGTLAATFGNLTSTNGPGGQAINLNAVTGTLTVTGATAITTPGAAGFTITGSSVAANFGTSTTVTDPVTQGILVGTSTGNISFGNTTVSDATDAVSLQNNSAGTRSFGTLSTTNGTGDGFLHGVGGGTTTFTGTATFTNPSGNCIDIQDSTTAVAFANVACNQSAQAGVFLDDNLGAVTFADLDIDTDANVRAFHATEPHSGAITTTSGTIADTGTAVAVEIVGTSAASRTPLNVTWTSVSSSGAVSGIVLTNTSATGSPGGFRIIGDGTNTQNASGGTIQNSTGNGINLTNTNSISLASVTVSASGTHGINANLINGLTLTGCQVNNSGNADNEYGMSVTSAAGTITINGTAFSNATDNLIDVTGTNALTFNVGNSSTFSYPTSVSATAGNAILLQPSGSASYTATIQNTTFTNVVGSSALIGSNTLNANGTHSFNFSNNTINVTLPSRGSGVAVSGQELTTTNITINNNQFTGAGGNGVISSDTNDTSIVRGTINGNTITNPPGIGMFLAVDEAGRSDVIVNGNTITNSGGDGIQTVNFGGVGVSTMDNTITNNTVNGHSLNTAVNFVGGIAAFALSAPPEAGDSMCTVHRGNNVTGTPGSPTQCGGAPCVDHYMEEVAGVMTYEEVPNTANTTLNAAYLNSINDPGPVSIFGFIDLTNGGACNLVPLTGESSTPAVEDSAQQNPETIILPNGSPKAQELLRKRLEEKRERELNKLNSVNRLAPVVVDEPAFFKTAYPSSIELLNAAPARTSVATDLNLEIPIAVNGVQIAEQQRPANPISNSVGGVSTFVRDIVRVIGNAISPTAHSQELKDIETKEAEAKDPVSGETITVNGSGTGFTIPSNKSTTITFRAVIGSPQPALTQVSNQGSVAGNFTTVLTDDPDVAGTANPTMTNIDHTTVAVASNVNPSVFGQNVTFTATMTGVPARTSDPPGTVQFKADGTNIGSPVPVVIGTANDNVSTAQASIATLAVGTRVITAEYSGGGTGSTGYNANIGTLTGGQVVGRANSATALTSSQNPSVFGQPVTFTATVTPVAPGSGSPTGTVNFLDGGNPITGCQNVTLQSGQAQCQPGSLSVGNHTITTTYSGDTNFNTSTGNMTGNPQVVNRANTSVGLASSQNPAPQGTNITFTATLSVTAPGAGTPSGTVQFRDGATPITGCTAVTVTGNTAACQTNTLTVGNHTISAVYSGDANFNTATGNLTGNPQVITGPPVITPAVGLTRVRSNPASNSQIATVSDDVSNPGAIAVTVLNAPAGITVANIVNTNGTITANITAACAAADGNNTVVLRATDGKNLTQDANLIVNVQPNPAPTLGTYANQTIVTSCKLFVTPSAAPADNVPLTSLTATSGTFGGTLVVDQTTGLVTASNSGPVPGPHTVTVTATDTCGVTATRNFTITVTNRPTAPADFDFDGDRKADISVYRAGATATTQSAWFILRSTDSTFLGFNFGLGEDRIVPGDYTGDGLTDLAVFRPSESVWYYSNNLTNPETDYTIVPWGATGDITVPGKYDADNKMDIAVFRPSNGAWFILRSTGGSEVRFWGTSGDKVIPADYDGDGRTDLAVWRAGNWYVQNSGGGSTITNWGLGTDRLVPADYDGDGRDDLAVYRPSDQFWYIIQSTGGMRFEKWGQAADLPVPADYDNDGKADLAIYRPSGGTWHVFNSCPCVASIASFGIATDRPLPTAYTP